jgi:hypothetical protein
MRAVRILIFGSLAAACMPFLLFLAWAYGPRWESGFERKYQRIQDGMTLDEVRQVIGFDGEVQTSVPMWQTGDPFVRGEQVFEWEKNGEQIWVGFDQGRVVSRYFHDLNYL